MQSTAAIVMGTMQAARHYNRPPLASTRQQIRHVVDHVVTEVMSEIFKYSSVSGDRGVCGSVLFNHAIQHMSFDTFDALLDSMVKLGWITECQENRFCLTPEGVANLNSR
jgi:hypothetical protein